MNCAHNFIGVHGIYLESLTLVSNFPPEFIFSIFCAPTEGGGGSKIDIMLTYFPDAPSC